MKRRSTTDLRDFRVSSAEMTFVGHDLQRPECILATRDGTLFASDSRGGIMRIGADGTQILLGANARATAERPGQAKWFQHTLPNGIAFDGNGGFLIADVGARAITRMSAVGDLETLYSEVDGTPLGIVNFVLRDHCGRIWFTVTTRQRDPLDALNRQLDDGFVGVIDDRGIRIVADGFCGTNELRLDADGEWLYVVESYARRISRLRVSKTASLSHREVFGPSNLDPVPDGCAFDAAGNLWVTCVFSEQLLAITPDGEVLTIFDEGNANELARLRANLAASSVTATFMEGLSGNAAAPWISSLTFGGPDLRTIYLGSGKGTRIASFRSPIAGQPMSHWGP